MQETLAVRVIVDGFVLVGGKLRGDGELVVQVIRGKQIREGERVGGS